MGDKSRHIAITTLRRLGRTALRFAITGLVFATCLWLMSLYLGLPVPSPSELLDKFKNVSRLADILS
jgi:hypothetical protein